MASLITRAGQFVKQPTGYRAFVPASLPPEPPIAFDTSLIALLSAADQAVGRLDGVSKTLLNPELFVAMYVRREAVLSSQIEGTQSSLDDVLTYELDPGVRNLPDDVEEVVNYVRAMNYGLNRLTTFPLSLRLIREIHSELLTGVRGADKSPGEFRTSQNWIGGANASLVQASFVPPPPHEMRAALDNFESFLHDDRLPALIQCGLAHAQFETIHPFLDGNGRVGRLLITFLLCHRAVLHRPLLYISYYLKRNRAEYYDRLTAIREQGNWEGWLQFFLRGIADTAAEATDTAGRIIDLREGHRLLIQENELGAKALRLLDFLFQRPIINVNAVKDRLEVSFSTANKIVEQLESLGIIKELTGGQRHRTFRYTPYLDLFTDSQPSEDQDGPVQMTENIGSLTESGG
ncbi:MAG: Fic family protein [Chloroflexota bacterium]|nr:Fic family protein [Chloroflexota bacterium]